MWVSVAVGPTGGNLYHKSSTAQLLTTPFRSRIGELQQRISRCRLDSKAVVVICHRLHRSSRTRFHFHLLAPKLKDEVPPRRSKSNPQSLKTSRSVVEAHKIVDSLTFSLTKNPRETRCSYRRRIMSSAIGYGVASSPVKFSASTPSRLMNVKSYRISRSVVPIGSSGEFGDLKKPGCSLSFDAFEKRNSVGKLVCGVGASITYDTNNGGLVESESSTAEEKVGVLLLNLGGPDTLNDVQPFLYNLFADPDIIRLPRLFRFLQRPLAQLISTLRAPKSKEGYASIGGGSPLRKITDEQAEALKKALEEKDLPVSVYVGMRYWYPFTEEAVEQIKKDKITRLVVLPLYPQFSISTTGSSVRVLQNMFREDAYLSRMPVSIIKSWYQREGYVQSMADLIEKELQIFANPDEVMIFFSAHGVPVSYVTNAGDPYKDQMEECIYLIMQELKRRGVANEHTLAYQSRVGPVQWLQPYTDKVLVELGQKGVKSLLAVPVSFVSEHIETLEEIDMEYRELALESGIENWGRVPALNCTPSFISDLADAVIEALPSATAMTTEPMDSSTEEGQGPMAYIIKILFGSVLAFLLLLSPKMMKALKGNL